MKIKNGVKIYGLTEVMKKPYEFYADLCNACGIEPVITDAIRPRNVKYSLHQDGFAIDVRLRELDIDRGEAFCKALRKYLGDDYDVIYYHKNRHAHIEYQKYLDIQLGWKLKEDQIERVK